VTNLTLSDAQKARLARLRGLTPGELDHVFLLLATGAPAQVDWVLEAIERERAGAGRQP
jgi:hypothetical protein